MKSELTQDWRANRGNPKGRLLLLAFRGAHAVRVSNNPAARILRLPVGVLYRVLIEWGLGVEIPWRTKIGPGLRVFHGVGLVINDGAVIGSNVTLRHNTTIGHKKPGSPSPVIGNNVDIGAGAIVIGDILIGDGCRIGAGAIVVDNMPAGSVAIGSKASIVRSEIR